MKNNQCNPHKINVIASLTPKFFDNLFVRHANLEKFYDVLPSKLIHVIKTIKLSQNSNNCLG